MSPIAANLEHVFVDLSNVVKDQGLGGGNAHAALSRWDRLKRVWEQERPGPTEFLLIADNSLRRAMSRAEGIRLDQMVSWEQAIFSADADIEVLRRAIEYSGSAFSNDRFVDHRRMRGLHSANLVGWIVRGPTIRLQQRSLDRWLSVLISARAQKQDLKELGLHTDSPELKYRWFCINAACDRELVSTPRVVKGSATCPDCDAYLDQGELWQTPIWLKIQHGATEITRFVIEDGEAGYVGRGRGDDVVSLAGEQQYHKDVGLLDERHLELRNDRGRLKVRDNHSQRGTAVRRPAAGQLNILGPPLLLTSGAPITVGEGVKVVLGRTLFTVQISGAAG